MGHATVILDTLDARLSKLTGLGLRPGCMGCGHGYFHLGHVKTILGYLVDFPLKGLINGKNHIVKRQKIWTLGAMCGGMLTGTFGLEHVKIISGW